MVANLGGLAFVYGGGGNYHREKKIFSEEHIVQSVTIAWQGHFFFFHFSC